MSEELVPQAQALTVPGDPVRGGLRAIREPDGYERVYGLAKKLAETELVPEHLKTRMVNGQKQYLTPVETANNVFAVCLLADRLNECPLILMQNINFIHGKPSFGANYVINRLNTSGLIKGRVMFEVTGEGASLMVVAYATEAYSGERVEGMASMQMAVAEGWTTKKGNKYATMPLQQLKYRAATFLARANFPEILFGYQTQEEVHDVHDEPVKTRAKPAAQAQEAQAAPTTKAEDLKAKFTSLNQAEPQQHTHAVTVEAQAEIVAADTVPDPKFQTVTVVAQPVADGVTDDTQAVQEKIENQHAITVDAQPVEFQQEEEPVKTFYGYPDPAEVQQPPQEPNTHGKSPF